MDKKEANRAKKNFEKHFKKIQKLEQNAIKVASVCFTDDENFFKVLDRLGLDFNITKYKLWDIPLEYQRLRGTWGRQAKIFSSFSPRENMLFFAIRDRLLAKKFNEFMARGFGKTRSAILAKEFTDSIILKHIEMIKRRLNWDSKVEATMADYKAELTKIYAAKLNQVWERLGYNKPSEIKLNEAHEAILKAEASKE